MTVVSVSNRRIIKTGRACVRACADRLDPMRRRRDAVLTFCFLEIRFFCFFLFCLFALCCFVLWWFVLFRVDLACLALSCPALRCLVLYHFVFPCLALSYLVFWSYFVMSRFCAGFGFDARFDFVWFLFGMVRFWLYRFRLSVGFCFSCFFLLVYVMFRLASLNHLFRRPPS